MQASKTMKLLVEYCGGWGYKPMYNLIHKEISKKWPGAEVIGKHIPGGSGCLEVKLLKEEGKEILIHSKLNGQGRIDTRNIASLLSQIDKNL